MYCGMIGMSLKDFMQSSWQYLEAQGQGYNDKEVNKWRHTREVVAMIYNTHAKRKKRSSELIKLPTDKKQGEAPRMTAEEYAEMVSKINQLKFTA